MEKDEAAKSKVVLDADDLQMVRSSDDAHLVRGLNRRDFMKYSVGAIASLDLQIIWVYTIDNIVFCLSIV